MRKPNRYPKAVSFKIRNSETVNIWLAISATIKTNSKVKKIKVKFKNLYLKINKCFTGNMNRFGYQMILENYLIPFVNEKYNSTC